ncbi:MAG: alpha/beta hydrolase, partial [Phycisphaerae bacterium]|nr:alpha/beta hydrolase [Phycisphaerae bacterium]
MCRNYRTLLVAVVMFVSTACAQLTQPALPPGTRLLEDLSYVPEGHPRQKLDLYLPPKPETPLPVVVWIHGGGWSSGSKDNPPAVRLTSQGYAVASINYRLTDSATFPAQIHDAKAAIRWLRAHADHYGLDPARIGVWGASAGGQLALLLGVGADVPELEGTLGEHRDQSSRVACVVDYFGTVEFRKPKEFPL